MIQVMRGPRRAGISARGAVPYLPRNARARSGTLGPVSRPRFLVPDVLAAGTTVSLPQAASHHALRVLRLRDGDPVILFDGKGREFDARFAPDPANASCSRAIVLDGGAVDREAGVAISLVQALCAQEKVDWLVEKAVELGAVRLLLAPSARSVVRLDGARQERRLQRWRDIAASAAAQCGRNRLLQVELLGELGEALRAGQDCAARWILDPAASEGLQAGGVASAAFAIGPEGGFTEAEHALARGFGYRGLRLGPRTLRTETAGLAAVCALLALSGEYGRPGP